MCDRYGTPSLFCNHSLVDMVSKSDAPWRRIHTTTPKYKRPQVIPILMLGEIAVLPNLESLSNFPGYYPA